MGNEIKNNIFYNQFKRHQRKIQNDGINHCLYDVINLLK